MAFFNFSTDWEVNKTGDELCENFIKDEGNHKKKHKNKKKYKTKLNNIFNSSNEQKSSIVNEIVPNKLQPLYKKHDNKSKKLLKNKKHVLKSIREKIADIHSKVNAGDDKIPLNSSFFNEFNKKEKHENKKSSKRKRSLSETTDGSDIRPLMKKSKSEKTRKNTEPLNGGKSNPTMKAKTKKSKKYEDTAEQSAISSHSNQLKKMLKKIEMKQIIHSTKDIKKINKKLKEKKKKQVKRPDGDLPADKLLETRQIDPIQLKKRKKQLEKLQNLILEKHEKLSPLLTKKEPVLTLHQKMMQKLKAARFRFLNEQIYTTTSKETEKIFRRDPDAFKAYHEGYRQQVKRWPLNPLDRIIKSVNKMPETHAIADFGCGEARLASSVKQKVHSFDLVAANDKVTACDMAHVPLQESTIDVAVFCLSLMGTNLKDYLMEANRVLKKGGLLKIAEVESRFEDIKTFTKDCEQFGFKKTWMDLSHNLFYFIDFRKESTIKGKKKLPSITLQPCMYKKR